MPGILDGIRIIDMTQFISGSRCTQLLADMGATVVHVEPKEGQTLRQIFDIIAQAVSGQFWNDQENLRLPCNCWADLVSGAYAGNAALLALIRRMRTGRGVHVDISMQDVLYSNNYRAMVDKCMEPIMPEVEKTLGRKPRDVLNSDERMPFYGFFKTTDGKVAIVALTQRQWQALSEIIGRPELVSDPRFSSLIGQIHNHNEALEIIESWTGRHASQEVLELLEAGKIPCGIAYTLDQVNRDENLKARGMFAQVKHARFGDVDVPGIPYRFSSGAGEVRMPGPDLGEHNELILGQWLGYGPDAIEALRTAGVIR